MLRTNGMRDMMSLWARMTWTAFESACKQLVRAPAGLVTALVTVQRACVTSKSAISTTTTAASVSKRPIPNTRSEASGRAVLYHGHAQTGMQQKLGTRAEESTP